MIRVASVPESHVYVRHLAHPSVPGVVRLPDPVPRDGRTVPGGWWPPVMLEPDWLESHSDDFDILHVHFGFDTLSTDEVHAVIGVLRRLEKPLVYTLHDLRNPHQRESRSHTAALDVLVPAAAALITLTPGARDEIQRRWDRDATVLPHPHVVPRSWLERPRDRSEHFVVGVHAKSLRASMDPLPVIEALAERLVEWPGAVLQVNVHDEIFDPGNYWYAPDVGQRILAFQGQPQIDVQVHPYFSDEELWAYLSSIDVSVLAYRFGTHSGWMEACHDLGTGVVVSDCGYYGEQRPCEVFGFDEHAELDKEALFKALGAFQEAPARARPSWVVRDAERRELAAAHAEIYAAVMR